MRLDLVAVQGFVGAALLQPQAAVQCFVGAALLQLQAAVLLPWLCSLQGGVSSSSISSVPGAGENGQPAMVFR